MWLLFWTTSMSYNQGVEPLLAEPDIYQGINLKVSWFISTPAKTLGTFFLSPGRSGWVKAKEESLSAQTSPSK